VSERSALVLIRDVFLHGAIEESVYVGHVSPLLCAEVLAGRNAMVPPALRLHDEEVEEWHDGDTADYGRFGRVDLGKIEGWRDEDIDLDAAAVGAPSGEAADEDLVRRIAPSGGLEEVSAIRVNNDLFDPFGSGRLVSVVANNDVDILRGQLKVLSREKKAGGRNVRDMASVGPEKGSRTAKEADIRCDIGLDNAGCAPSNFQYFLFIWGTSGPHV